MYVPWGPLACVAGAVAISLLYKKYAPVEHQKISSPVFLVFLVAMICIFGGLAFSLLPQGE